MESPKRSSDERRNTTLSAYNYYAAFSQSFARSALDQIGIQPTEQVLDPWNGRGTTTCVAAELGIRAQGFDLNPAMVTIAKSHLASREHVQVALEALERNPPANPASRNDQLEDGLVRWLTPQAARHFRVIQSDITHVVTRTFPKLDEPSRDQVHAFLSLVLCGVLRDVLRPMQTLNPSWIRMRVEPEHRLSTSIDTLRLLYRDLAADAVCRLPIGRPPTAGVSIAVADSRTLPLPDGSISATVSSPPYCTRIDYAVATSPELFLLGHLSSTEFDSLRRNMLGTTAVSRDIPSAVPFEWGSVCSDAIRRIGSHSSRASSTYYLSTFLHYFDGLSKSIREIDRVSRSGASVVLVVQDSDYKEVHLDLQSIVIEMAEIHGWRLRNRMDHPLRHTLAGTNPRAREYRSDFSAIESVLHFVK